MLKIPARCSLEHETHPSLERRSRRSSVRLRAPKIWELAIYTRVSIPSLERSSEQKTVARAWNPSLERGSQNLEFSDLPPKLKPSIQHLKTQLFGPIFWKTLGNQQYNMFWRSICKIKAQGWVNWTPISNKLQEQDVHLTCMYSIEFKASNTWSNESILPKTWWIHELQLENGHACEDFMKTTSNSKNMYMHAWINSQFNTLNHNLTLTSNNPMNHARTTQMYKWEDQISTLGLEFQV